MRPVLLSVLALLFACSPPQVNGDAVEQAQGRATPAAEEAAPAGPVVCPEVAAAPDVLPGVRPEHRSAAYWIERSKAYGDPDAVLLDAGQVGDHSKALREAGDALPFSSYDLDALDVDALRGELAERFTWLQKRFDDEKYVGAEGQPLRLKHLDASLLRADLQPELRVALANVQFHCAPSPASFYTPALDQRFDRNHCSTAHAQEPVQVLGVWPGGMTLARTRYTYGWIAGDAPLSPPIPDALRAAWLEGPHGVLDEAIDGAPAEARVPLAEGGFHLATPNGFEVRAGTPRPLPRPITRRAVIEAAFAQLGEDYGWGGRDGGRDCSRFVMDLFGGFGLDLPRHTASQAHAGSFAVDISSVKSERERVLLIESAARRGLVLMHFPGHIMLYLGRDDDGRPMAIHAFAEYLIPCEDKGNNEAGETLLTVDTIQVSDLELGRGSSRTAFIERITHLTVIGPSPGVELQGAAALRPAAPVEVPDRCRDGRMALFNSPRRPIAGQPLRVVATGTEHPGPVRLTLIGPDGQRHTPEPRIFGGPPYSYVAQLDNPRAGSWKAIIGDGARVEGCLRIRVRHRAPKEEDGPPESVWVARNQWNEAFENFYAAWVEALFDYPADEDLTWDSLHALTREPSKNILFDHLGQDEDADLRLDPDCADLPYLLRAYFAWKVGLPYGFRRCNRGRAGRPPTCGEVKTHQMARSGDSEREVFQKFARRKVRNYVHSASGRTHPKDEDTDYYPIPLTRETLRPGTLYADPHGHMLVIAKWVSQGIDGYGTLIAADAQPDGTVGRRRFWRGSFLFTPDTTDVGAGFKAFRPIVIDEEGEAVALTNDELKKHPELPRFSMEQYEGTADDFYARMQGLINPRPLDPLGVQRSLVDALDEAVARRVVSVNNGEEHKRKTGGKTIPMPTGYAIFETTGPWEDFSTPARDMRMLISIDTVLSVPDQIRRDPGRFGLEEGDDIDAVVAKVEALRDGELAKRSFEITRSNGTKFELTLKQVIDRRELFEMSWDPNDCVERRWAAREGDPEYSTCKTRAPADHQKRMKSYRPWFQKRQRPPR